MEQNKEDVFKRFLAKAEKRAEEKKIHRTCLVRVPSMDERIRMTLTQVINIPST